MMRARALFKGPNTRQKHLAKLHATLEAIDKAGTMSMVEARAMVFLGWDFILVGPDEWGWRKFKKCGMLIAQQGGRRWNQDWIKIQCQKNTDLGPLDDTAGYNY